MSTEVPLQVPIITHRNIDQGHLIMVGVEHEAPPSTYPWKVLEKVTAGADKIVAEYFPPELENTIFNTFIAGAYARDIDQIYGISAFFGGLAYLAGASQKDVLVMDPANNFAFEPLHRAIPAEAMVFGGMASIVGGLALSMTDDRVKRRDFLKLTTAGLVTCFTGIEMLFGSVSLKDMRPVTIAQGLNQHLIQTPGETLAVVYPQDHIRSIDHYLDNPEERAWKYSNIYNKLAFITRAIRHYTVDQQWTLKSSVPILG